MAFHNKDENIYFIGTEEGSIHRCSKSYKEQYLDSFYGHTGAVYKVGLTSSAATPFAPTCSCPRPPTGRAKFGTSKKTSPSWS